MKDAAREHQEFVDALRAFRGQDPLYKKKRPPQTERFVKLVYGERGYDTDGNRRVGVGA